MKTILILITFSISFHLNSQNEYNSLEVYDCVNAIQEKVDSFMKIGDVVKMQEMMIDAKNACVEGLSLAEYSFKPINSDSVILRNLEIPAIIKVSSSWCSPCLAEIPAINRIADEFKDEIKVIILFWDDETYVKNNLEKYSSAIDLVPPMKGIEDDVQFEVSEFNHYIGFPASYFLDTTQKIKYLTRGAVMPREKSENQSEITLEEANDKNYERIKTNVLKLLNQ